MKNKLYFILFMSLFATPTFAQKVYRSSYQISITKEETANNFGFSIETSQGIRVWKHFIVSANVSYTRFTKHNVNFLPIKGEVKWYLFDLTSNDDENNYYVFLNAGKNLKLGNNFANDYSASIGFGINIPLNYDNTFLDITMMRTSVGSMHHNIDTDSYGLKIGLTF